MRWKCEAPATPCRNLLRHCGGHGGIGLSLIRLRVYSWAGAYNPGLEMEHA